MVKPILVAIAALLMSVASASVAADQDVEGGQVAAPIATPAQPAAPASPPASWQEVRQRLPQYANFNDDDLFDIIHKGYYPDIERSRLAVLLHYTPHAVVAAGRAEMVGTGVFWLLVAGGLIGYFYLKRQALNAAPSAVPPRSRIMTLLIVSLGIFGPALSLGNFKGIEPFTENYAALLEQPEWATYRTVSWLTLGMLGAISIFASLRLRFVQRPGSLTAARVALIAWPICALAVNCVVPLLIFHTPAQAATSPPAVSVFGPVLGAAIWLIYLWQSKQVAADYGCAKPLEQQEESRPVVPGATTPMQEAPPHARSKVPFDDRELSQYEVIGRELESGQLHHGTWLKAFADADGDADKAKARYIKLRLASIQAEASAAP